MSITTIENIRRAQWQMEQWLKEMVDAGNIPALMISLNQNQTGETNVKVHLPPNITKEQTITFLRQLLAQVDNNNGSLILQP